MRYRETLTSPKSPLEIYTSPVASICFDFITFLSITTVFSRPDLVNLSRVPNLGILEIVDTTETRIVNDRLIRAWSLAALDDGAFKVLRILRLWHHIDLTRQSLDYLNRFPALGVYDVRGCGFDVHSPIHARCLGWKPTVERDILNLLLAACIERSFLLQGKLGLPTKPIRRPAPEQLGDGAKVSHLPRSEVAGFLTRDETSRPGTPRKGLTFDSMNKMMDKLQRKHPVLGPELIENRWEFIDRHVFRESREKMAWDFQLSSAYARLGELRDDRDLGRAGIDISNQAVVDKELVNSVPMVSIRLGGTSPELRPTSAGFGVHKPLYNSVLSNDPSSSLKRLTDDPGFDPKTMCFVRIEVHSEAQLSAMSTFRRDKEAKAPKRKSRISISESKKMKLGDVLGSFLG